MNWPDDYINKVICGDCLEVMKDIPDGAVDLVVTDPEWQIYNDFAEELFAGLSSVMQRGAHIFCVWNSYSVFKVLPAFEVAFRLLNIF